MIISNEAFRTSYFMPAIVYHVNQNWHIAGGIRYMRLVGDAEGSPIVDNVGSKDQFIFGADVLYSWGK